MLLCLAIALTFMPAMAFAESGNGSAAGIQAADAVGTAEVSIPVPVQKDQVGGSFKPKVTLPEGSPYKVSSAKWVKDSAGTDYPYSVYVDANQTYYAKIELEENESGTFVTEGDNKTTISAGSEWTIQGSPEYAVGEGGLARITAVFAVQSLPLEITPISSVAVNVTAPKEGDKVKDRSYSGDGVVSLPGADGYGFPSEATFPALSWYDFSGRMKDNEAFVNGRDYTLYIKLITKDNNKDFTEDTKVNLTGDGKVASVSLGTDGAKTTLTIRVDLTLGADPAPVVDPEGPLDNISVDSEVTGAANGPWTVKLTAVQNKAAVPGQKDWDGTAKMMVRLADIFDTRAAEATASDSSISCWFSGKMLTVTGYNYSEKLGQPLTVTISNLKMDPDKYAQITEEQQLDVFGDLRNFYIENTIYNAEFPMRKVSVKPVAVPQPVWDGETVKWNAVDGATEYEYMYYSSADYVAQSGTTTATELSLADFIKSKGYGTYTFRVAAKTGSAVSREGTAEKTYYNVTARTTDINAGTVTGSEGFSAPDENGAITGLFPAGSQVTLTAEPKEGYTFGGFYAFSGETPAGADKSPLTFTVDTNHLNVVAYFAGETPPEIPSVKIQLDTEGHEALAKKLMAVLDGYQFEPELSGDILTINKFPSEGAGGRKMSVYEAARQVGWLLYEAMGTSRMDDGQGMAGVALNPKSSYSSMRQVEEEIMAAQGALSDNTKFYILWADVIPSVDMTVAPLKCGTNVRIVGEGESAAQEPAPQITIKSGAAHYSMAAWLNSARSDYFTGTARGDVSYNAYMVLEPEFGYCFNYDNAGATTVRVNNRTVDEADTAVDMNGNIMVAAGVTAEHEYETVTQTEHATCTEPGHEYRIVRCSHCGKEIERTQTGETKPLDHDWGDWMLMDNGRHIRTCKRDTSHYETGLHVWEVGEKVEDGVYEFSCETCHVKKTVSLGEITETGRRWIAINENDYKEDSVKAVKDAVETLDEISRKENPTDEEIKEAVNGLNQAISDAARKDASTVTLANVTATYNGRAVSMPKAVVKGSAGAVTYKFYNSAKKQMKSAPVNAGTYYAVASVAADKNCYAAESGYAKITIKKAANRMTAKRGKTLKASKKKTKKFARSRAVKVSGAAGAVSFRKAGKTGGKRIKVNPKTGKITVKKGLKKGKTYKVRIMVTAAGDANFAAKSQIVTVKIKVKK